MENKTLFFITFSIQIFTISMVIPWWVKNRLAQMMNEYPPTDYPKLYPVSVHSVFNTVHRFNLLSAVVMIIGLGILAHAYWNNLNELLAWDNQSVLTLYFMLQYVPFIILASGGIKYYQMMRQLNTLKVRSASLQPRKLSAYISAGWLIAIAISSLLLIGTIFYMAQYPFPGFVGYWNVLFVAVLNGFFWLLIQHQIKGKKSDPHQTQHDRNQQLRFTCHFLVLGWLAANLFLCTNMWLAKLELKDLNIIIQSIYFTLVALLMSQTSSYQPSDYSVYKTSPK